MSKQSRQDLLNAQLREYVPVPIENEERNVFKYQETVRDCEDAIEAIDKIILVLKNEKGFPELVPIETLFPVYRNLIIARDIWNKNRPEVEKLIEEYARLNPKFGYNRNTCFTAADPPEIFPYSNYRYDRRLIEQNKEEFQRVELLQEKLEVIHGDVRPPLPYSSPGIAKPADFLAGSPGDDHWVDILGLCGIFDELNKSPLTLIQEHRIKRTRRWMDLLRINASIEHPFRTWVAPDKDLRRINISRLDHVLRYLELAIDYCETKYKQITSDHARISSSLTYTDRIARLETRRQELQDRIIFLQRKERGTDLTDTLEYLVRLVRKSEHNDDEVLAHIRAIRQLTDK